MEELIEKWENKLDNLYAEKDFYIRTGEYLSGRIAGNKIEILQKCIDELKEKLNTEKKDIIIPSVPPEDREQIGPGLYKNKK